MFTGLRKSNCSSFFKRYVSDCMNWHPKGTLVPLHAMKAHKSSGGVAPLILNLCSRWRWALNRTPLPLYPRHPLTLSLGLEDWQKRKLCCQGSNSLSSSSLPSQLDSSLYPASMSPASLTSLWQMFKFAAVLCIRQCFAWLWSVRVETVYCACALLIRAVKLKWRCEGRNSSQSSLNCPYMSIINSVAILK